MQINPHSIQQKSKYTSNQEKCVRCVVEVEGIDPPASRMRSERSTIWATPPRFKGHLVNRYINEHTQRKDNDFFADSYYVNQEKERDDGKESIRSVENVVYEWVLLARDY